LTLWLLLKDIYLRGRSEEAMDDHNFMLNDIFKRNAKEYQTKPVRAARYRPGIENGWMVYFTNKSTKEKETMAHEGVKFFSTESKAWDYIYADNKQYIKENGQLVEVTVEYDPPKPVLYRKDADAINKDGMHFCFGEYAFISDESCDYEFYIMECDCWIIQEIEDGNIRVWYPDSKETFFGNEKEIVFEKVNKGEYIQVAV